MGGVVSYPITGTEPADPRYDLGAGASGAGSFFGGLLAQRMLTKRLARDLNPMREAMLQGNVATAGAMDTPESIDAQSRMTTEQRMIAAAARDPMTFARTAGSPEGALALGGKLSGAPRTREIVVHGGDELNTKLGLNLKEGESAPVTLNYDANDNQLPGFSVGTVHYPSERSDESPYGQSSALAEVMALEKRRVEAGMGQFTPEQFEIELNRRRQSEKTLQQYNAALDQHRRGGGDMASFPSYENWTPNFTAQQSLAGASGDVVATELSKSREAAATAMRNMNAIQEGMALLKKGNVMTGPLAGPKLKLAQLMDVALGRANTLSKDATAAETEAYIANAGRLVGQTITLFGAGTGLSDADRAYAKQIAGGEMEMTEQGLYRALEILAKANVGTINQYNTRVNGLGQEYAPVKSLFDTFVPPTLDFGQQQNGVETYDLNGNRVQ